MTKKRIVKFSFSLIIFLGECHFTIVGELTKIVLSDV